MVFYNVGILLFICQSANAKAEQNFTSEFRNADLFEDISDEIHSGKSYHSIRSPNDPEYNLYNYVEFSNPIAEFFFSPKYLKIFLTILFTQFGSALNVKNLKSVFQNPSAIIVALLLNVIIFPVLVFCLVSKRVEMNFVSRKQNKNRFN